MNSRRLGRDFWRVATPYSLGKLIEWKLEMIKVRDIETGETSETPYSLGKLIEWKL